MCWWTVVFPPANHHQNLAAVQCSMLIWISTHTIRIFPSIFAIYCHNVCAWVAIISDVIKFTSRSVTSFQTFHTIDVSCWFFAIIDQNIVILHEIKFQWIVCHYNGNEKPLTHSLVHWDFVRNTITSVERIEWQRTFQWKWKRIKKFRSLRLTSSVDARCCNAISN